MLKRPHFFPVLRVLVLLTVLIGLSAVTGAAPPDWENQQVVGRNKEPGRATSLVYATRAGGVQATRAATPYFQWYPLNR
jgi:hypothetical protein